MEEKVEKKIKEKIEEKAEKKIECQETRENTEQGVKAANINFIGNQDLVACMKQALDLKEVDAGMYSPLVLAYIGDDIYDLVIRTYLLNKGNMQVNKINKHANALVKAQTQSEMIKYMEPEFTNEELSVYKRGRNAKSVTTAKNATVSDYRRATGFETVMGYLYLCGRYERMMKLIKISLEAIGELE